MAVGGAHFRAWKIQLTESSVEEFFFEFIVYMIISGLETDF